MSTDFADDAARQGMADETLARQLREAVLTDPLSAEGKALRASVGALHAEEARRLILRSANASQNDAAQLRELARKAMISALIAERVQLETAPTTSACLLDPPPDAPADVIAATTALGATVRWTAPNNNGKDIRGRYTIGISPRPLLPVVTLSGTQATVNGLSPGTVYTFTVTATNDDGTGPASMPSNTVRVGAALPMAATNASAAENGVGVTVTWTAGGGGAPTAHRIRVYDAAQPTAPLSEQRLDGAARSATFAMLAKGNYIFGVRPFSEGGFGDETRTASFQHAPAPTVFTPSPFKRLPLPTPDALMLFDLGDAANSVLDPTLLRRRMTPIFEQATQWRFDYLKNLAIGAAKDTLGYDQLLGQLMQMTVGKVVGTQAALHSVVPGLLKDLQSTLTGIENLAASDLVQGIIKRVGDAAADALALEGLIHFLIDDQPLDFWIGLFDGLIGDIAHFDRDLTRTNEFLYHYFDGPGAALINAIRNLTDRIDQEVDMLIAPLAKSVEALGKELNQGVQDIIAQLEETVVTASMVVPGADGVPVKQFLGNSSGLLVLGGVADLLTNAVEQLANTLRATLHGLLQDPRDLCVSLIKFFIVYPILGILIISLAGGPIAAGILAAIVCVAGIELIRLVARWLSGPLLGLLNDAEQKVVDTVHELQGVLQQVIALVPKPLDQLEYVAASVAGLAHLLPQKFLQDVGLLIGEARRSLLSQATELALTAERALGLENATAFDVMSPGYDTQLTPAPDLPGGADASLFAGLAVLRDFNRLDVQRTKLLNAKETVVTLRLSLFKLLGGIGSPANFVGDAANLFQTFLKGGPLLLNLNEETLIEQGFPGLYRALIVDVKPIGLLSAVSNTVPILPSGIPLTITHMGRSRIRIKRDSNPSAPPILLPDVLRLSSAAAADLAAANSQGQTGRLLTEFVDELAAAAVPSDFNAAAFDVNTLTATLKQLAMQRLPGRLHAFLDPALTLAQVSQLTVTWINTKQPFVLPDALPSGLGNDAAGREMLRNAIRGASLAKLGLPFGAALALRAALLGPIDAGRKRELPLWAPRVAKWGGAHFDRERDPHIESLGFVTLVQDFPAESAAFNLLAEIGGGVGNVLGGLTSGFAAANPARGAEAVTQPFQYRAFENRGVEGEWLLNLESALNPGTLLDLLLEITVRGCYDEGLATAVKASRQQSSNLLGSAQAVASKANKILRKPGSLPLWNTGISGLKTVHYSVRAHRDNLLQQALAAQQASGLPLEGLVLDAAKAVPLGIAQPLLGLTTGALNTFTLQFKNDQSVLGLGLLHGLLPISPADFGLGANDAMSEGILEAFNFVIIPSGKLTPDVQRKKLLNGISFDSITSPLAALLPQLKTDSAEYQFKSPDGALQSFAPARPPIEQLLFVARTRPAQPVTLADVFGGAAGITLDFADAIDEGYIYDVIFSLSVRTPVPQLTVAPSAIAI